MGAGLAVAKFESDHSGIGYGVTTLGVQLYGGFEARDRVGAEIALDHLPEIAPGVRLGSGVDRLEISADHSSITLRGVYSVSLQEVLLRGPRIDVFATAGVARSIERRSVLELTTMRRTSVAERHTALVLGAGVTLELERLRIRTYLQSGGRRDGTLDSVGAAVEFRF